VAEVIEQEQEIKTKQGEVLDKGKLFLKVAYLNSSNYWRTTLVPVVIEDNAGMLFEAEEEAMEVADLSELRERYLAWVGREANITVFLDDIEDRYDWLYSLAQQRGDQAYKIRASSDVPWRTELLTAYEESWREEIVSMKGAGEAGGMKFVIPILINLNGRNKQIIKLPDGL
jgi:hypothetical protein